MIKSAVALYPSVNFEVEGRVCESWAEKAWSALVHRFLAVWTFDAWIDERQE